MTAKERQEIPMDGKTAKERQEIPHGWYDGKEASGDSPWMV